MIGSEHVLHTTAEVSVCVYMYFFLMYHLYIGRSDKKPVLNVIKNVCYIRNSVHDEDDVHVYQKPKVQRDQWALLLFLLLLL